ncbi:protein of unknown function [Serratia sp. Tan611]|nr:protein of unknown function [Serratia sp. Tan611]
MYEYIFAAVLLLNETKTFTLIEPLNLTGLLRHYIYLLNIYKTCHKAILAIAETLLMGGT